MRTGPVFACVLLAACSGGGGGGGGFTPQQLNSTHNISGDWAGVWTSDRGPTGSLTLTLAHDTFTISGTIDLTGSPCLFFEAISGSTNGVTIEYALTFSNGTESGTATFRGTIDQTTQTMVGSFSISSNGPCDGDAGRWSASRSTTVAGPLTGTWSGSWIETATGSGGSFSMSLTQVGTNLSGSVAVEHATPCFRATTSSATGSASGSTITINLTGVVESGMTGNMLMITGTLNAAGTTLSGTFVSQRTASSQHSCLDTSGTWTATQTASPVVSAAKLPLGW